MLTEGPDTNLGGGSAPLPIAIRRVREPHDLVAIRDLFIEYAGSLPVNLTYQNFDVELAHLPGAYAEPLGALFLAVSRDGLPLGCVALRPGPRAGIGEIKRLYVRPEARGCKLGERLARAAMAAAREAGYSEILLDTLPSMTAAQELYARLGFTRTDPYYHPTPPGTVFMVCRVS